MANDLLGGVHVAPSILSADFGAEDVGADLPAYRHPDEPRHLLTLPHRDNTAGFFVARLRRAGPR